MQIDIVGQREMELIKKLAITYVEEINTIEGIFAITKQT
jgi:hypothetical protein